MRIKLLLIGLLAAIALAFLFEPASEKKSKKRGSKQPLSAIKENVASMEEKDSPKQLEPIEDRYEEFPPEREISTPLKTRMKPHKSISGQPIPDAPKIDAWSARSWLPPAPKPVVQQSQPIQVIQQRPSTPVIPAMPFEFVGVMDAPAGGQVIFLRQGERQHSVQVGETIDQQWRVERLAPDRVIFKYLPANTDAFVARGRNAE